MTARKPYPVSLSSVGVGVEAVAPFFAQLFDFNLGMEKDEKEGDHHVHLPVEFNTGDSLR
jgi:hypothetical protein